jgi:hypothetical protein
MTSGPSTLSAIDCASFFEAEGVPAPPLPLEIAHAMRPQGRSAFASADWPGGLPMLFAASRWLEAGAAGSGAWCGLIERGVHSTTVQVGVVAPRYGIFIRRFVSQAFDDAAANRRRVQGSFELMRRITEAVQATRAWPPGKRLAIIDDDTAGVLWGWVADTGAQWSDLVSDGAGWMSALVSVESLARAMG